MKRLLTIGFLVIILISCAKDSNQISEPEKIADVFFETYKKSGPKEALTRLLASNKYVSDEDAKEVSKKLEQQVLEMGHLQGIEKLREFHTDKE